MILFFLIIKFKFAILYFQQRMDIQNFNKVLNLSNKKYFNQIDEEQILSLASASSDKILQNKELRTDKNTLNSQRNLKSNQNQIFTSFHLKILFLIAFFIVITFFMINFENIQTFVETKIGNTKDIRKNQGQNRESKQNSQKEKQQMQREKQKQDQNSIQNGEDFQIQIKEGMNHGDHYQNQFKNQNFPKRQSKNTNINPWAQSQASSPIKDKYFFKIPIQQMIVLSRPDKFFGTGLKRMMQGISFYQLQLSIRLLQVNHNVNFKGEIQIQLAPYDTSKAEKKKRIKQMLERQEQMYEKKYEIKKYLENQLPFCLVTPSYNNVESKLFLRNLDSMFMQNYQNYHIVYMDDASPDKTGEQVLQYINERKIPSDKIKVIINEKNIYALNNIYNAIHYHCKPGQIAVLIDGDDAFIGRQVLGLYNAVYQRTESALVYSTYLHVMFNQKAIIGASSRMINYNLLKNGQLRKQQVFFTSHLLTFYVDLFRLIKKSDLTYQNGTFFKYAYDVAMCTPMIQMIEERIFYIPQITYEYRFDTGQNDPSGGQTGVVKYIYDNFKSYQPLESLPFIDDRENYLKNIKQAQQESQEIQQKQLQGK